MIRSWSGSGWIWTLWIRCTTIVDWLIAVLTSCLSSLCTRLDCLTHCPVHVTAAQLVEAMLFLGPSQGIICAGTHFAGGVLYCQILLSQCAAYAIGFVNCCAPGAFSSSKRVFSRGTALGPAWEHRMLSQTPPPNGLREGCPFLITSSWIEALVLTSALWLTAPPPFVKLSTADTSCSSSATVFHEHELQAVWQ